MAGNVCVGGTVTLDDGSTLTLPETMWRVRTTNPPELGFTRTMAGDFTPIGLTSGPCMNV
jgi:hypothetical protein